MKRAFTMLELVFVIVIMGIAASIGAEIIAKLYENYIQTRSINKLQFQTELVLNQIAKRLTYRIKDSVIGEKNGGATIVGLSGADDTYPVIAWIGKSYESSLGNTTTTGWSGFVDLDSNETNATQIKTNGSHLGYARDIINALSYGKIDINDTNSTSHAVLIFKGKDDYNVSKYGWNGAGTNDANYTYNIQVIGGELLKIKDKNITTAYEQYNLAWSAYAIVPEGNNTGDFNLTLKYNFQPWDGEKYSDANTSSSVLMEHVSSFKFMQYGETIRLKLCIRDDKTGGDYGFCKEKVIF
ncbi:MAG: type II secretion system protein [Epsilonproteobacteria bacterium]|nr:type II secretion system protein [Campylobacterota bacterium]